MSKINHPQIVDWNNGELRPAPRKKSPDRRETKYQVICTGCGNERWLSKQNATRAETNQVCRSCQSRANGKKTYAIYGEVLQDKIRAWRLENPSSLEQMVIDVLVELNIPFEREFKYCYFNGSHFVDFKVYHPLYTFYIEADGLYFHSDPDQIQYDRFFDGVIASKGDHLLRVSDYNPAGEQVSQEEIKMSINQFISHLYQTALPF